MAGSRSRSKWLPVACYVQALVLFLPIIGGCSSTKPDNKGEMEQDWNQVRAKVKFQLATQQYEAGLVDEAIQGLEEAVGLDPGNPRQYILLARCLLEQGKVASAQRAIDLAAALDDASPELSYVRGMVAERRGRLDDALAYYRYARNGDDSVVDYVIAEAECLVAINQPNDALRLLERSLNDYDNNPSIHALIGEIALLLGDDRRAAHALGIALSDEPDNQVIAEQYALVTTRRGKYAEALAVLEPIVNRLGDRASPSVVRAAARCMLSMDRFEAAKMTLYRLVERDNSDRQAWLLLAWAGMQTGDAAVVGRSASQLRRLAPGDTQVMLVSAYADMSDGRLATAIETIESILQRNPDDVLAHYLMGYATEKAGAELTARKHYQTALSLDPNCLPARSALDALVGESAEVEPMALTGQRAQEGS